jgi:lysophospholipase L1-like esterase
MSKELLKRILSTVIILTVAFCVLELTQRVRYYLRYKDTIWLKYGFHKVKGRFPAGVHIYNHITYTINSRQFRGKEFLVPKPVDTFRIVALGDSVTFGIDNPDECTYPQLLENLYSNVSTPPLNIEVINAGTPGYPSGKCLSFLKKGILEIQPDLLIVMVGWNDVIGGIYEGSTSAKSISNNIIWSLTRKSLLLLTLREKIASKSGNIDKMYWKNVYNRPPEKVFQRYEKNLRQIINIATVNKIEVFLIKFPYRNALSVEKKEYIRMVQKYMAKELKEDYKRIHNIIDEIALKQGTKVLDAASYFSRLKNQDELFSPDGIHLSNEGNKILARLIFDFIKQNHFIK